MNTLLPDSIAFITHQNNKGIDCLRNTNYEEAISVFAKALREVRQLLNLPPNSANVDDAITEEIGIQYASFIQISMLPDASSISLRHDKAPFIFKDPIFFNSQPGPMTMPPCYKLYASLSYIMLYNLALTHHIQAVEAENEVSLTKLRKALWLYEAALSIQMKENISLTVMQTMAIVNNIGHIHSVRKDTEKARDCFQRLLSAIMIVKDCIAEEQQESMQQLDGFLANVSPLILKQSCAGAA